jgi:serine/threonine protein kinase
VNYVCPQCGSSGDAGICETDGTAREPAGSDALLGTMVGSWRIARLLGAGGMGRVYAAIQPEIGARVAIKVLRRDAEAGVVDRFFNEARAVNVIRHENIVDVIDLGRLPDGAPYIVMEYLEGSSLGAILRRDRQLPLGTLARVVGEVLAALVAAHAKDIIHRDLKPDNVFVSPGGRVTVLDFGIAKLASADALAATETGSLLGTPTYMSPEQARSQPIDARADLYSAGVILYEGATGAPPFTATNLFDLLKLHVEASPAPPSARRADMPLALEAVILRALAKDPADRFASAAEMKDALAAAVADLPEAQRTPLAVAAAPGKVVKSDPFAPTAASTQASLARGEQRPVSPTGDVRVSRKLLVGMLATAGLVGLGGAAIAIVLLRGGSSPPAPSPPPTPVAPPDALEKRDEIDIPPPPPPVDAAPVPVDARPKPKSAAVLQPDGSYSLRVSAADAFEPFTAYSKIVADVERVAGAKLYPHVLRWHGLDRTGRVTGDDTCELIFISPERHNRGEPCFVTVDIKRGVARIGFGDVAGKDCNSGDIMPPHCSFAQLRAKAVERGLPADSREPVSLVHNTPTAWMFNVGSDFSEFLDDDCR